MRRRLAVVIVVGVLLLAGCAPQYATPDERSQAFGSEVAERLGDIEPQPDDVRVRGSFDGITIAARLGEMSFADSRTFIESALPVVRDSPLGAMPIRLMLSHAGAPSGVGVLEWRGYDPEHADRYFAAVELWLDVLADPGVEFRERFEMEKSFFFGSIDVLDGRDVEAYRHDVLTALEEAGFREPSLAVSGPQPG